MLGRRAARAAFLALGLLAVLPTVALAHSELESSTPAEGAILAATPTEIRGEFSEPLDPARSSLELRGPDGAVVARGGVPDGGPATRMTITDLPALPPGPYVVRWTTVTPDDEGVERGTFTFSVEASPSASPTAPASAPASLAPAASSSTASTAAPSASPAPAPAPAPAGGGDLLIPLVVLGAVLVGGVAWLLRRR
jgi:methionine-rich copper-binding protein CopC